jgi:hypothetical protein
VLASRSSLPFVGFTAYVVVLMHMVLLTSLNLDVMRVRFLWIAVALGIGAAAHCAPEGVA